MNKIKILLEKNPELSVNLCCYCEKISECKKDIKRSNQKYCNEFSNNTFTDKELLSMVEKKKRDNYKI